MFASWSGWRPLALDLEAQVGDGIYYGDSDASSFLAWQEAYTLNATARPTPRISLATNVQRLRLAHTPTSGDVIDLWLVAVRTTAQFSRQLYARVYPQYDSITRHLALNGLVAYVVHPGSVVYVGANSGWEDVQQRRRAMSRQFFAKASWRFSL